MPSDSQAFLWGKRMGELVRTGQTDTLEYEGLWRKKIEIERRLGLATNSSSTHSLIFLARPVTDEPDGDPGEFGWGMWTAASPEMKRRYFAATLYANLVQIGGPAIAAFGGF